MDEYTYKTMTWLNRRYKKANSQGIYLAHQPIYGFADANSEPNVLERYNRALQILNAVSHLSVNSLVDVGAAEGFIASLVRDYLELEVHCTDLSEEACKRAGNLFHLRAIPADARELPFSDGQFDVALCSETLEHIVDYPKAIDELLRVARKAVVITVPHEKAESVNENREQGELHAHINSFELDHFDYLKAQGFLVIAHRFQSQYLYHPGRFIEQHRTNSKRPAIIGLLKLWAGTLLSFDRWISEKMGESYALLFVLIKDPAVYQKRPSRMVSTSQILGAQVEHLYLK